MEKEAIYMNRAEFIRSIHSDSVPSSHWSYELKALWWDKKGAWVKAHHYAQKAASPLGDCIHAYLHRVEGDLGNASYWYSRSGRAVCRAELSAEWNDLTVESLKND